MTDAAVKFLESIFTRTLGLRTGAEAMTEIEKIAEGLETVARFLRPTGYSGAADDIEASIVALRAIAAQQEKRDAFLKAADDYCDASSSDDERDAHGAYLAMLAARHAMKEQPSLGPGQKGPMWNVRKP
jgi:hypothetical protein